MGGEAFSFLPLIFSWAWGSEMANLSGVVNLDIKIGDTITLRIDKISSDGSGVGRNNEGFVFFVPFALPGETVEVKIIRLKKNYGLTQLISILKKSHERVPPPCKWFGKCGGCQLQHSSYQYQLKIKTDLVREAIAKIAHVIPETPISECAPSPLVWNYRNKASFPVRKTTTGTKTGFFIKGTHEVVPVDTCLVNDRDIDLLYSAVSEGLPSMGLHGYTETSHGGMVRHIIIRKGIASSELLLSFVLKKRPNRAQLKNIRDLANELKAMNPCLMGITCNINSHRGNVILGEETLLIGGRESLSEDLAGLSFRYSSTAFFQINTFQAENLFSYSCDEALVNDTDSVLELYSGVGVLTSMLASRACRVTAVEEWSSSVESMKQNLIRNSLLNVSVVQGKVEDVTGELKDQNHDIVVLDPPRSGCDEQVIDLIKEVNPSRIIYISCNPATLARDISRLFSSGNYILQKVKPFDMFPHTSHVETVATICRHSPK